MTALKTVKKNPVNNNRCLSYKIEDEYNINYTTQNT